MDHLHATPIKNNATKAVRGFVVEEERAVVRPGERAGVSDSTATVLIYSLATPDDLWNYPQVRDCTYGIDVATYSRPKVRGSIIDDHSTCVHIGPAAQPDLGRNISGQYGNNVIKSASNKLAGGHTRFGGIPDVYAEKNYRGSSPPNGSKVSS